MTKTTLQRIHAIADHTPVDAVAAAAKVMAKAATGDGARSPVEVALAMSRCMRGLSEAQQAIVLDCIEKLMGGGDG